MPHSPEDRKRATTRLSRIRGQTESLSAAIEKGSECAAVLQQLAAIRGAINGLMAEILEGHMREEFGHLTDNAAGIDEAIAMVRSYLK